MIFFKGPRKCAPITIIRGVIDTHDGKIGLMPAIPESTKTSLAQRLRQHARDRWPELAGLHVRYHGQFAYVEGELTDGDRLPLVRLRYGGSASIWGFGLYLASSDKYENQILPSGMAAGTPQEALDCACGLYLSH